MTNEVNNIPKSFSNADEIIGKLFEMQRKGQYIFRGISKREQNNPSLKRYYYQGQHVDLSDYEFGLIHKFIREAAPYFPSNFEMFDYLAIAQHYRVPTRLLDWTRNPFVALFFSINRCFVDAESKHAIYVAPMSEQILVNEDYTRNTYGHLTYKINDAMLFYNFISLIEEKDDKGKIKLINTIEQNRVTFKEKLRINIPVISNYEGLIILDLPSKNERLRAQQGLFSIPRSLKEDDPIDEVNRQAQCIRLCINEAERKKLIEELKVLGYSLSSMFPELESIGRVTTSFFCDMYPRQMQVKSSKELEDDDSHN